jgi:hypothetical protein
MPGRRSSATSLVYGGNIANVNEQWQHLYFVPHQTPCPHCAKVGLVRTEHVITGTTAILAFYCGGCDHQWSITEIPGAIAVPRAAALPNPRAHNARSEVEIDG